MASNPYVNKVEYAGQTIMDLTGDTATSSDVLNGKTFHDRSGAPQTGSLITHNVYDGLDSSDPDDALSAKQGKVLNDKMLTINQGSMTFNSSLNLNSFSNVRIIIYMKIIIVTGYINSNAEIPANTEIASLNGYNVLQEVFDSPNGSDGSNSRLKLSNINQKIVLLNESKINAYTWYSFSFCTLLA